MSQTPQTDQITIDVHIGEGGAFAGLAEDVREGLSAEPKQLLPKYFYDERGSRLFTEITRQPEYYQTRTEASILRENAAEIVGQTAPRQLVELGSGSGEKTRVILDAMHDADLLGQYLPVDISAEITRETASQLVAAYPGIDVYGVICDFDIHLELLPPGERRLFAFLGSTIGNFRPEAMESFLYRLAGIMGPGDRLLLGTDLVKDRATLEAAYNDAAGVTAEFNKNVLHVLNGQLGADFDPDRFEHVALYDAEHEQIDIRLRSLADQRVTIPAIDLEVAFTEGEEMRTEISRKFTRQRLERAYTRAGMRMTHWLTDAEGLFALSLAEPAAV